MSSDLDKPVHIGDNFGVSGEMSGVSRESIASIEDAIGAELLRARLLGSDPPRLANRYLVQGLLGRGATGVVVEAHDERLKRQVALKLSPLGDDDSPLVEARALASLDHPNVVRVFDVLEAEAALDGQIFRLAMVAMQLVKGFTLRAWLSQQAPSPREILRIYSAAGEGLQAAHALHIVHRDFKPDNVLVGEDGVARVIDFGFAVNAAQIRDGEAGEVAGTGPYLAPEAKRGEQTVLGDQYAFGMSLAEALTGELKVPGVKGPASARSAVWKAIRRMTASDPSRRFADMGQALRALAKSPKGLRVRLLSALALVVVLASVGGIAVAGSSTQGQCAPEPPTVMCPNDWSFETIVDRSSTTRMRVGSRGGYTLGVEPDQDGGMTLRPCRIWDQGPDAKWYEFREARHHCPHPAAQLKHAVVAPAMAQDGGTRVSKSVRLLSAAGRASPFEHNFEWFFHGDDLTCTYTAKSSAGQYSGHCTAGHRVQSR